MIYPKFKNVWHKVATIAQLGRIAETTEFQEFLHREFPRQASEWLPSLSRRNFLQLMGASLAFAGLTACASPQEKIVPYVQAPENEIPGQSLFFATASQLGGYAKGVLAQSQLNRAHSSRKATQITRPA